MPNANPRRTRSGNASRFVKNPHPSPRPAQRKGGARRKPAHAGHSKVGPADRLPGWKDLSDANEGRSKGTSPGLTLLDAVPTFRMAVTILAIAGTVTLYVGHVLSTQELMSRTETLRRENLALHLRHNRVKGAYDRASSPAVIYERARMLGLTQQVPNGPVIEIP